MNKTLILLALVLTASWLSPAQTPTVSGGPVNSASFAPQPVAPGSLVSIFGSQLAASSVAAPSLPLPLSLGGVSVKVNGTDAPMFFVSTGQVNFQMPWDVLPAGTLTGTATMVLTRDGLSSPPRQFPVRAVAPGIFRIGGDQAVAVNLDGSLVAPADSIAGTSTHPAKPGDTILIYATGLGNVDPPPVPGANSAGVLRKTVSQPVLRIDAATAPVLFSGLSPDFAGVNQLNVTVPVTARSGDWITLQIQSADGAVTDSVTIAVEAPLPPLILSPEERTTSLNAIQQFYQSNGGTTPPNGTDQLVAYLNSRPELRNVTVASDGVVSAEWIDGVGIAFFQNVAHPYGTAASGAARVGPLPLTNAAAACPAGSRCDAPPLNPFTSAPPDVFNSVPGSNKAKLIFSFPGQFDDSTVAISDWLKLAGYDVQRQFGSLDDLESIGGEGVLFWSSHGGICAQNRYCIVSSTAVNFMAKLRSHFDLSDKSVIAGLLPGYPKPVYAVTAEFLRKHWKNFSNNSFVYIDACEGLPRFEAVAEDPRDTPVRAFRQTVFDKNASVYAGWTTEVEDRQNHFSYNTAQLVFDRLLGANSLSGDLRHTPDERPFPLREVVNDFALHPGIGYDSLNDGYLGFSVNPQQAGNGFGILKPSIYRVQTQELTNELLISGSFGDAPTDTARQPIIRVDGIPFFPEDNGGFKPQIVSIKLPVADPPIAGEVTVEYGPTRSNPATLSSWQGTFEAQHLDLGTLITRKTMKIALRADVRTARIHIHETPSEPPQTPLFAVKGGTLVYLAEGEGVCGTPGSSQNITDLSGGGTLPPLDFSKSPWFVQGDLLDSHSMRLRFQDGFNAMPMVIRYTLTNPPQPSQIENHGIFLLPMPIDFNSTGVKVALNSSYGIVADQPKSSQQTTPLALCPNVLAVEQIVWPAIPVHFPPNRSSPR